MRAHGLYQTLSGTVVVKAGVSGTRSSSAVQSSGSSDVLSVGTPLGFTDVASGAHEDEGRLI